MSKKLGVGIIGCGGIANAKHMPNLLKIDNVEVIGVCDLFQPERAVELIRKFGLKSCSVYENYYELLKNTEIESIHVCTPNESHAPITIDALNAGKNVMCEKPMAMNVEQAQTMADTAKRTGKKLTICANNRFRPDSWYLKEICTQGMLGHIYYAKAHAIRRRGVPTWGNFMNIESQGGGPMIDIGTHALDLALWMMDNYEPQMVLGKTYNYLGKTTSPANPYGNWDAEKYTVEDSGFGMIIMKNGTTINLESSWALNIIDEKTAKVTLCGIKAGADMDNGLTINGEMNGRLYEQKIILEPQKIPFYGTQEIFGPELEIRLWVDALLNDKEPVVKPEQMVVVAKIIQALYESDISNKPIYFE